jgi:hypothetical protein
MTQRTTAISAPPSRRVVQTTQVEVSSGQATAIYDYAGADSGDLSVQSGQVVNVIEKTSDDCELLVALTPIADRVGWTCEDGSGKRGLVPASYLKA